MKHQVLFSLKNNENTFMASAAVVIGALRVNNFIHSKETRASLDRHHAMIQDCVGNGLYILKLCRMFEIVHNLSGTKKICSRQG